MSDSLNETFTRHLTLLHNKLREISWKPGPRNPGEVNVDARDRRLISKELEKYPELKGIVKVESKSKALSLITKALDDAGGFKLDMVTGDEILGDKGSKLLTYSAGDVNDDGVTNDDSDWPSVSNSRINFTWEAMGDGSNKVYEIIAYVT